MRTLTAVVTVITTGLGLTLTGVGTAEAAAKPKVYKSCAALHKAYPNGVAKSGAVDKPKPGYKAVKNFKTNGAVYAANKKLDTDHDKIACEKVGAKMPAPAPKPAPAPAPYVPTVGDQAYLHDLPYGDLVYRYNGYGWAYYADINQGTCTGGEGGDQADQYGIVFRCTYTPDPTSGAPAFHWMKVELNHNTGSSTPNQQQPPPEYAKSTMQLYFCPNLHCV